MKKFSKVLAASLALVMVLGMTVCAASPTTANTVVEQNALEEQAKSVDKSLVAPAGVEASAKAATSEQVYNAIDKALDVSVQSSVAKALGLSGAKITDVLLVIDLKASENNVTLTFKVPGASTGKTYALLHMNDDGSVKEVLPASCNADGSITATFTTFSIYAVVEVTADASAQAASTSPKTSGALPVVGFVAMILLVGAVLVYTKKMKFNH